MVGIYMIENKVNGKKYIGQSWDIKKRWLQHKTGYHNSHLESAIIKYGIDNFEFRVLCELNEVEQSQLRLDDLETAYIDLLETTDPQKGYNNKTGGSCGKHSEESKKRMSKAKLGKRRKEQDKVKISNSMRGKYHTEDTKIKCGLINRIKVMDDFGTVFDSINDLAKTRNIWRSVVDYRIKVGVYKKVSI